MKKIILIIIINFVCLNIYFGQCSDVAKYDIYTPMGSSVLTYITCEDATGTRQAFDNSYGQAYPDAQQIIVYDNLSSTRKFNCHGYAWIRLTQGIDRWLGYASGNRDPDVYMTDGSYVQVPTEVYPGKVFWTRPGDHSAVTTGQPGWFISKWGRTILCKHSWDDNPYGTSFKYYRRCTSPTTNFTNQTVNTNQTVTGCDINVQNVTVTNNKKLILDAVEDVTIIKDFEVQLGSELEIK